jgi:hypothetical protein
MFNRVAGKQPGRANTRATRADLKQAHAIRRHALKRSNDAIIGAAIRPAR